jgi:hypothetical protein
MSFEIYQPPTPPTPLGPLDQGTTELPFEFDEATIADTAFGDFNPHDFKTLHTIPKVQKDITARFRYFK